jgi:hypothetical protein
LAANTTPTLDARFALGSREKRFANVYAVIFNGTATSAQYADLAERYEADMDYPVGTLVKIGGEKEVTMELEELSDDVFGVISSQPGYLLNGEAGPNETHPPVALAGRVPVRVVGQVQKGTRLVSAGTGRARAVLKDEMTPYNIIGRALHEKISEDEGLVEAVIRLSL